MYKEKLWKPVLAGTLALAMALVPAVSGKHVSAVEHEEMLTEVSNEEIATEETEEASQDSMDDKDDFNTAGDIPLTAEYFPDANFRKYISENVDKDKNGVLSQAERDACTEIDVAETAPGEGVYKSLTGIQYFTQLKVLKCEYNQLTSLDVSKNTQLTDLSCWGNQLTSLDISNNPKLICLRCEGNQLTSLDVSKNTQLTDLRCYANQLTSLDVSKNTQLTHLECSGNQLTNLDVSNNPLLTYYICAGNQLTSLDVSKNTQLTTFECSNNQITNLDVSKNTQLTGLGCSNNQLISLDVSKNTQLSILYCSGNRLACLDLTKNTKIKELRADGNEYPAMLNNKCQIDLATIPGFQVSKVSNVSGGTISGTVLTFNSDVKKVTYTYDCGNGHSVTFTVAQNLTKAFCTRLYTLCLGRAADESGVNYWTQQLLNKKQTGASLGYNFVFSDEYKKKNTSDEAYVKMLYEVFMGRSADNGGLNYWLDLLNQGMSREYVYKGFAESKEFTNICASYGIERGSVKLTQARDQNVNLTKFVNRIYVKAMNRKGEEKGLNYWCGQIRSKKMTPVQVAESFIYSKEFTDKNLSNTEYIKVLYRTFMGREADSAGLNYWLGRLNKGDSRKTVLKAFAGCQEFKNIVKSFGL